MILILDIDGTLNDLSHRYHFIDKLNYTKSDWNKFLDPKLVIKDPPLKNAQKAIKDIVRKVDVIFFITGRYEKLRYITTKWLKKHYGVNVDKNTLYMRSNDNMSSASEYKEKIIVTNILPLNKYKRLVFIDDDPYVLSMYSKYGIVLKAPECFAAMQYNIPDAPEPIFNK